MNYIKGFLNMLRLNSWQQILLGLVLGAVCGCLIGKPIAVIAPIGELFIRAIHMIIVPVVFLSITNAICSTGNLAKMRHLSIKAILLYSFFMLLASSIGLIIAYLIKPGVGLAILSLSSRTVAISPTQDFSQGIINLLPNNIFDSFVSGNIMQILLFSIIFGIALNLSKEKSKPVIDFINAAFQAVIKIAQIVMKFAPLGVFALIACVTSKYGLEALIPLLKLVISVYLGCLALWVCYGLVIFTTTKQSPLKFFKIILNPILVSYTTSSSAATLPVTLNCAEKELGIDKATADFLLPLGTSLNLNGLSVYLTVATIFAANVFGIHLTLIQYLKIPVLTLVTAMGAAAVPGSALIVMGAIQSSLGIPLGAISLIAAVDRLNDMAQTCTNVSGDISAAYLINHSEKVGFLTKRI